MNKEPLALYIFRLLMGAGLFAFMCMLYWSSTLIEQNVSALRNEVEGLKSELTGIKGEAKRIHSDMLQSWVENDGSQGAYPFYSFKKEEQKRDFSNSPYENLLQVDPFYKKVLPELLGKNFEAWGVQQRANIGKPDTLHPFSNWADFHIWQALCNVSVGTFQFGKYETLAPSMGIRMEERPNPKTGIPEFWVFLRDDIFWQPLSPSLFPSGFELSPHFLKKHQVTAEDFKFYIDAILNPYVYEPGAVALRTLYDSLEEVEVVDDFTFIVRWKAHEVEGKNGVKEKKIKYIAKELTASLQPMASFVYQYFANGRKIIDDKGDLNAYRTNSVWAQNFAEHWAKNIIPSCGPYIFRGMTDRQIKFEKNSNYPLDDPALSQGIDFDFKPSPDNVWQQFKNNHLDSYNMQPEQIDEFNDFLTTEAYARQARSGNAIKRLDYLSRLFTYIGWNLARPMFSSAKVRQALTMAIDRKRIIQEKLQGMGVETTGPFLPNGASYDSTIQPWPFNPMMAKRLLEEAGWRDSDGDGIIDKMINGKLVPFSFTLSYPVRNTTFKNIAEYIVTAMKEIGIECRLNGLDTADLTGIFDDKNFDALLMMWRSGTPPDDPKQLWHSSGAKEKGSSNMIGFANAEADKIIEALAFEYDLKKRTELYHRFHAIIHEEQPYTFLYVPKIAMLYRQYLKNVFIPAERQDLIPGADVEQPQPPIFWLQKH